MTQPTPTAAPPALLNITLGVMLALMLGWFFHIASGVLVPMVLGLMISYVVMAGSLALAARKRSTIEGPLLRDTNQLFAPAAKVRSPP